MCRSRRARRPRGTSRRWASSTRSPRRPSWDPASGPHHILLYRRREAEIMPPNKTGRSATMPDVREQAAVLTLVAASKGGWHRTASLIEEAGSALKLLRQAGKGLDALTV